MITNIDKYPLDLKALKKRYNEWIMVNELTLKCSECGVTFINRFGYYPNFCPHCGSRKYGVYPEDEKEKLLK